MDLLPFVTGVGELVRATKMVKYADEVIDASYDTIRFMKATDNSLDFAKDGLDIAKGLNKTKEGFTISNKLDGIRIHKSFMNNGTGIVSSTGKKYRLDELDDVKDIIFELKPGNPSSAKRGVKQILNYNSVMGGGYKLVLVFY